MLLYTRWMLSEKPALPGKEISVWVRIKFPVIGSMFSCGNGLK